MSSYVGDGLVVVGRLFWLAVPLRLRVGECFLLSVLLFACSVVVGVVYIESKQSRHGFGIERYDMDMGKAKDESHS